MMAPVSKYKCKFNDIVVYGLSFKWERFRDNLYKITADYTDGNSLELDVLDKLSKNVGLLRRTLISIVNCMNDYPNVRRCTKLWDLSTEGHKYYESLCCIFEDCSHQRPVSKSSDTYIEDHWYIKTLLGVDGYLYKILKLTHNIESWYIETVDMLKVYSY